MPPTTVATKSNIYNSPSYFHRHRSSSNDRQSQHQNQPILVLLGRPLFSSSSQSFASLANVGIQSATEKIPCKTIDDGQIDERKELFLDRSCHQISSLISVTSSSPSSSSSISSTTSIAAKPKSKAATILNECENDYLNSIVTSFSLHNPQHRESRIFADFVTPSSIINTIIEDGSIDQNNNNNNNNNADDDDDDDGEEYDEEACSRLE
ncbi:hypothetical protein SSS_07691 [Sarcoptes scabiei]|uniref:Uncharacterized protein n=1 Tax=Sarcoptes scabiei TaxID=52283 RepID=A0A834VCL6_SARSC|nr:hypothetical protein SSS_07691 [Sarcoptes scabiei]